MTKIPEFLKANPLTVVIGALVLVALLWYFGGSVKESYLDRTTERKAEKLEQQIEQSQQKAQQEVTNADRASGARAAEDERRQVEIKPQIERTRVNREQARINTQKAAIDYENSRKTVSDPNGVDVRALRERNCSDFKSLYPDEPGCPR